MDALKQHRKKIVGKLKIRHAIFKTPIPRVRIKVSFRADGSWHWNFGDISYKHLRDTGQMYDAEGKYICTVPHFSCGGQDYCVNRLWAWLKEAAYKGKIHPLDLA